MFVPILVYGDRESYHSGHDIFIVDQYIYGKTLRIQQLSGVVSHCFLFCFRVHLLHGKQISMENESHPPQKSIPPNTNISPEKQWLEENH